MAPLVVALIGLSGACADGARAPSRALLELERLTFVPEGRCSLSLLHEDGATRLHVLRIEEDLLFDMYEVTRGDWLRFVELRQDPFPEYARDLFREWSDETEDWPASFMTLAEAREYARSRGMRLPAPQEWVVTAMDASRESPYPWGHIPQDSVANTLLLDLFPKRPTPVGTFEGGSSRLGCYDLLGNVWEWVEGRLPPPAGLDSRVSALGGSYLSGTSRTSSPDPRYRPIYDGRALYAQTLDPRARSVDVGLRCCTPAAPWLRERAGELGDGPAALGRLRAIGKRWGPRASRLLQELVQSEPRAALEALLAGSQAGAP